MIANLQKEFKSNTDMVDARIIKFFEAYDMSLQADLEYKTEQLQFLKQQNKKMLNKQASSFTECSEFENLLLDAVDVCRKDVVKRQQTLAATQGA